MKGVYLYMCDRGCVSDFRICGVWATSHQYSERVCPVSIRRLIPTPCSHLSDARHACVHAQKHAHAWCMCLKVSFEINGRSCNKTPHNDEAEKLGVICTGGASKPDVVGAFITFITWFHAVWDSTP